MAFGMPTLVVGNLTADPSLAFSQNGKPYLRLTIANTPRIKNRDTGQYELEFDIVWEGHDGVLARGGR